MVLHVQFEWPLIAYKLPIISHPPVILCLYSLACPFGVSKRDAHRFYRFSRHSLIRGGRQSALMIVRLLFSDPLESHSRHFLAAGSRRSSSTSSTSLSRFTRFVWNLNGKSERCFGLKLFQSLAEPPAFSTARTALDYANPKKPIWSSSNDRCIPILIASFYLY